MLCALHPSQIHSPQPLRLTLHDSAGSDAATPWPTEGSSPTHALSLVNPPTVGVSRAFTLPAGHRQEMHITTDDATDMRVVINNQPVAEGGHGVIYAAADAVTGAPLVLKHLKSRDMEVALAEALQEANVAQDLDSPVAAVAVVRHDDGIGILAPAKPSSMYESLKHTRSLPWNLQRALALNGLWHLLHAVSTVHQGGYVHGDIKTDNIFFDEQKVWVLGDYGQAIPESDIEERCRMRGTMAFWAPEIFSGGSFSQASDIWNVGLVYLEMLGGSPLITTDSLADGATLGSRWEHFVNHEQDDLENSPWMQENPSFADVYNRLSRHERRLICNLLGSTPDARHDADTLLGMLECWPYALTAHRTAVSKAVFKKINPFAQRHAEKMRQVLSPDELARFDAA